MAHIFIGTSNMHHVFVAQKYLGQAVTAEATSRWSTLHLNPKSFEWDFRSLSFNDFLI
jgi:hypothetical protein